MVPEKNVTEIFCDADADDARRRKTTEVIPICRLRKSGQATQFNTSLLFHLLIHHLKYLTIYFVQTFL